MDTVSIEAWPADAQAIARVAERMGITIGEAARLVAREGVQALERELRARVLRFRKNPTPESIARRRGNHSSSDT